MPPAASGVWVVGRVKVPGSPLPNYAGAAAEQYAGVTPWPLTVDPERLAWIGRTLGGEAPWGIFVVARTGHAAVRRQLRRLLSVRLPEGTLVRFRFYDTRVLEPFLRVCTEEELRYVFGSLSAFATVATVTREVRVWDRPAHPAVLPERFARVRAPSTGRPQLVGAGSPSNGAEEG